MRGYTNVRPPLRYVGQAFKAEGAWWRQGKVAPYLIADELDTSRIFYGRWHQLCEGCALGTGHSSRFHRLSVLENRKEAICVPERTHLIVTP